jgi:hypothetical protein
MASAGRILIMPKGNYNAETEYDMLDLVYHNGTSWLAKKKVVGIEPSDANSEYWHDLVNIGLGNEDISKIGDGTLKGAINHLDNHKIGDMAKYYGAETAQNSDELLDNLALIPISTTVNTELYNILFGTFAWVLTFFYKDKTLTSRRVQIALSYNSIPSKMAIRSYGVEGFDAWREVETGEVLSHEESCDALLDKVKLMKSGKVCQVYLGRTTSEIVANTTTHIATISKPYRPTTLREGMVSICIDTTTLPLYVGINAEGELSIRARETIPSGVQLYGLFTYIM